MIALASVIAAAAAQCTLRASVDVPLFSETDRRTKTQIFSDVFPVELISGGVVALNTSSSPQLMAVRVELYTNDACPTGFSFGLNEADCGVTLLLNGASYTSDTAVAPNGVCGAPPPPLGKLSGGMCLAPEPPLNCPRPPLPTTEPTVALPTLSVIPATPPPFVCKAISSWSETGRTTSTAAVTAAKTDDESSATAAAVLSKTVAAAALGGAVHWRSAGLACVALGGLAGVFGAEQQCNGVIRVSAVASSDAVNQALRCPPTFTPTLMTIAVVGSSGNKDASINGGWQWAVPTQRVCGRPFFGSNEPEPILAAATTHGKSPSVVDERAARWTEQALGEHASVASFAAFSLQLMVNGAPFSLLAGAAQANADEVRHAELALALASRFAGTEISVGAFPRVAIADLRAQTIGELAEAVLREGCVGETLSVLESARQVDDDAGISEIERTVLHGIVRDELKHSALA